MKMSKYFYGFVLIDNVLYDTDVQENDDECYRILADIINTKFKFKSNKEISSSYNYLNSICKYSSGDLIERTLVPGIIVVKKMNTNNSEFIHASEFVNRNEVDINLNGSIMVSGRFLKYNKMMFNNIISFSSKRLSYFVRELKLDKSSLDIDNLNETLKRKSIETEEIINITNNNMMVDNIQSQSNSEVSEYDKVFESMMNKSKKPKNKQ